MKNIVYEDATKMMSRGQIVIPIEIRKRVGLENRSLVRVKLTSENNIVIELLNKKTTGLASLLEGMKNDKTIYWTKKDDKRRNEMNRLSMERTKKLKW